MTEKLLPCPLCGEIPYSGEFLDSTFFTTICKNKDCKIDREIIHLDVTHEKSIKRWNTLYEK